MSWRIIRSLVGKDITLFARNRFFAFVSVLGIVAYAVIYFLMPSTIDEVLSLGMFAPELAPMLEGEQEQGISIDLVDDETALMDGVMEGDYVAGIAFPEGYLQRAMDGQTTRVDVFYPADAPTGLRDTINVFVEEFTFLLGGQAPTVEIVPEVLGFDTMGQQIPPRDRLLPLFAVFLILTETLGLASLISEEIEGDKIRALLITPMTVNGLFVAKGITGVGLAFVQAALFLTAVGGLSRQPILLLVALLVGALLVTGIGFALASLGKDLTSVMGWGVPVIIILSIPAFGVLFPGVISDWAKAIPSYYLVDTVHQVANFGLGWGQVWQNLVILFGFSLLMFWLGAFAIRRKIR